MAPLQFLRAAALAFLVAQAAALAPPPVQCQAGGGCTVSNYLDSWRCPAAAAVYPRNQAELVEAVEAAAAAGRRMRAVSRWSQSLPMLVCPGGDGVVISTRDLDNLVRVDPAAMTVEVDAGVLLKDLVEAIARQGFAIPAAPYWGGVSIAGALSTGAHGSSLQGAGGALHDHVAELWLVVVGADGRAKVVHLIEGDPLLDAARISLGTLGIISKVVFKLEPMFKRSVELQVVDDDVVEERLMTLAEEVEFGDICWHPSLGKMMVKLDRRVKMDYPGQGVNKYRGFQAMQVSRIEASRAAEEKIENKRDSAALCGLANLILNSRVTSGNGYLNDGTNFTGFPVVGFNHVMQTASGCERDNYSPASLASVTAVYGEEVSECGVAGEQRLSASSGVCSWDTRINGSFFHQVSASLPVSKVKDFIQDVKKLREAQPTSMCGLSVYGGIYLRFVKASSAYLGQKEDGVEFDFTFYRSRDERKARLNQDVMDELEQMALFKYQGKPHWGKNRNIAFAGIASKVTDVDKFLAAKQQLDPKGYFSNDWTEAVLGGKLDALLSSSDHCALQGMCICSEDRHCAPEQGYFCRQGRVFEDARVCRRLEGEETSHVISAEV